MRLHDMSLGIIVAFLFLAFPVVISIAFCVYYFWVHNILTMFLSLAIGSVCQFLWWQLLKLFCKWIGLDDLTKF